jgi:glycosyltransferase involved in cell wall biosynthesis
MDSRCNAPEESRLSFSPDQISLRMASAGAPEEFAEKLLNAANLTSEQRETMSQRNRQVVSDRADWDKNSPRLMSFYEGLA